jgi:hypothetical protein
MEKRSRKPELEDDDVPGPFEGARKADLIALQKRGKAAAARRKAEAARLAKLVGGNPKEAAAGRQKEYDDAVKDAAKRMADLRKAWRKHRKTGPPLMKQIQALIVGKGA